MSITSINHETYQNCGGKAHKGLLAYPSGIQGVVVGEGDSYEEALNDVRSAILFHVETFGRSVLESESSVETQ